MNVTSLKKITLKDLGIEIPSGGGDFINKTVALISGRVTGYGVKITPYGESNAFTGTFMAVNALTGEVFDAPTLYIPGDYSASVAKQSDKMQPGEELAIEGEVVVAASKKGARGYTFVFRQISSPEVVNAKAQIAEALVAKLKLLPAPVEKDAVKTAKK